jgi:hypothetical protein
MGVDMVRRLARGGHDCGVSGRSPEAVAALAGKKAPGAGAATILEGRGIQLSRYWRTRARRFGRDGARHPENEPARKYARPRPDIPGNAMTERARYLLVGCLAFAFVIA